jgi:hypothetical protein
LRFQSLFFSVCAVSLVLVILMPTASADIFNASYDGSVGTGINTTWPAMRIAQGDAVRVSMNKTWAGMTEESHLENDTYDVHWRALVTWDTSGIPDDATITSAVVSVYGAPHKMDQLGTVNFAIVDADPRVPLAYEGGDYSRTTLTRMAGDISFNSYTIDAWNNWTLNPLGRNNISKTGVTTFMFTHSADVDNSSLNWVDLLDPEGEEPASGYNFLGLVNASGAYAPFITIEYTSAVSPVLIVSANLTTVTAGTSSDVTFTVRNATSTLPVSGASVTLTGVTTGTSITGADGNATISVNATEPGTIIATANLNGYVSNTTTVTATALVPVLINDKIGISQNGVWYLDWNGNGAFDGGFDKAYTFGAPGWTSVVGDWNATGNSYIGVTNGQQWYLDMNNNGAFDGGFDKAYSFGAPGWTSIVGDWNHDGKTDIGVTNGQQWYLDINNNGAFDGGVDRAYNFGAPGWTSVVGDWNATGNSNIGVTNGQQWYLDWNGNGVWDGVDKAYIFGAPGWKTVVGKWN